jgi:aryl-alcohol dehydrogenase-like predicted oxidoreductase
MCSDIDESPMELRRLGTTDILVTPVAFGCWPISGVTSVDVNEADSLATLEAALASGVNFVDTAHCYGYAGESERLIGRVVAGRRDAVVIATKGGIHWDANRRQARDGRPETLRAQCEESLRRLATDHVDLLYLHAPDPNLPLAESAGGLARLLEEGKTRAVGLSNASVKELVEFSSACSLAAFQPHYNLLQREIEADSLPWCRERNIAVVVYWPLMKGLLAGRLARDHVFAPGDGRAKYPMFQGQEWQRNQDFLDCLRAIAADAGKTVAQVVINWVIHQEGITSALCGAKRAHQAMENAQAAGWRLSAQALAQIDEALAQRGTPITRAAV